jgi:hypothetical protein
MNDPDFSVIRTKQNEFVLARCWEMGTSAISINDLATLSRFPILRQAMIRILAMLLLLLVASGARAEAKDCYRKALGMQPQAGLAQAGRQRVTNDEK